MAELTNVPPAPVACALGLAVDVIAQYELPEPMVVTASAGQLRVVLPNGRPQDVDRWAAELHLLGPKATDVPELRNGEMYRRYIAWGWFATTYWRVETRVYDGQLLPNVAVVDAADRLVLSGGPS